MAMQNKISLRKKILLLCIITPRMFLILTLNSTFLYFALREVVFLHFCHASTCVVFSWSTVHVYTHYIKNNRHSQSARFLNRTSLRPYFFSGTLKKFHHYVLLGVHHMRIIIRSYLEADAENILFILLYHITLGSASKNSCHKKVLISRVTVVNSNHTFVCTFLSSGLWVQMCNTQQNYGPKSVHDTLTKFYWSLKVNYCSNTHHSYLVMGCIY